IPLTNGNYLVRSQYWNVSTGAATWGNGSNGTTLDGQNTVSAQNSLLGPAVNAGLASVVQGSVGSTFLASFATASGGQVQVGLTDPKQLTYALGQSQTVTLTPEFLTRILNAGANVTLQASNDITVSSAITATPAGMAGSLTLKAGRSLLFNAGISTGG